MRPDYKMKKKSKNRTICFDARMISHSGIGTQVFNVLTNLVYKNEFKFKLLGDRELIANLLPEYEDEVIEFHEKIYSIAEQFKFPKPQKNEIIHSPHYNAAIKNIRKTVVVVHDLIHLQSAEFSSPKFRVYAWLLLSIVSRFARHIITVSDTTRMELVKHFPQAASKTTVIHNGINHDIFFPATKNQILVFRKSYNVPTKFFLTVGIGKRHKNIDFIVRTLAPGWKSGSIREPLVVAGTKGKLPDYIKNEANRLDVNKHIIVLPFLQEEQLAIMYSAAMIFIYPSLFEGFGFPLVEAMACGCPVLSSSTSCLPEIGADAALYFDPNNEDEFRKLLIKTRKDKTQLDKMKAAGLKRAKFFNWKKHTQKLIKVYESV